MGLFDKFFGDNDNKSSNETVYSMPTSSLVKGNSNARVDDTTNVIATIDEETAMKIGALHQGVNIVGDTISSLPMHLYKETEGFHEVFLEDPRSKVMSDMANETLSSFNLKKALLKDLVLRGNAYAKIERTGKTIMLRYIPPQYVTPKKDNSGYYFEIQSYSTDVSGERFDAEVVDFYDMLVLTKNNKFNSITGVGLLNYANDTFATSVEETKYMYNLLVNGLSSKAILNSKSPFKREIKEQLKKDLKQFYSGANNAGKIMLLEGDVNVLPLALTPTDIRLLENKAFTISEIARFLNIPKHMLGIDKQQGTYSNITQERLQLLQNTLMPFVVIMEQAMNQKLLDEKEREQGYYFKFDVAELMKMTPTDQADYMLKLWEHDIVVVEEVRAKLGLGGDDETIAYLKAVQDAKLNIMRNEVIASGASANADGATSEVTGDETDPTKEVGETPKEEDTTTEEIVDDKNKKSSKEVKK